MSITGSGQKFYQAIFFRLQASQRFVMETFLLWCFATRQQFSFLFGFHARQSSLRGYCSTIQLPQPSINHRISPLGPPRRPTSFLFVLFVDLIVDEFDILNGGNRKPEKMRAIMIHVFLPGIIACLKTNKI